MGGGAGEAGWSSSIPHPSALLTAQCQGRSSPDPSGIRPVPGHSCCCQERGHRLVEEEVVLGGAECVGSPGLLSGCQGTLSPSQAHVPSPPAGRGPSPPGRGGRRLLVHSPPCTRCWWTPAMCHKPAFPWAGAGTRCKSQQGPELLGLCPASSILPQLHRAQQPSEYPPHHGAASWGGESWSHRAAGLGKEDTVLGRGSCFPDTWRGWPGAAPTHINELLLLLLRHLAEAIVSSRQVSGEAIQRIHSHLLHLPPLSAGAGWRQAQPADAAPSPDPG